MARAQSSSRWDSQETGSFSNSDKENLIKVDFTQRAVIQLRQTLGNIISLCTFNEQNDSSPLVYGLTFLFRFRRLKEM